MTTFGTLNPDGSFTNVREIKQSDLMKCPFMILMADHYRNDGTCKCNDPEHREFMKKNWEYTDDDFRGKGLI